MTSGNMRALLTAAIFVAVFGFALREAELTRRAVVSLTLVIKSQSDMAIEFRSKEARLAEATRRSSDLKARLEALQSAKKHAASYGNELKVLALAAKPWREITLEKDTKLQAMYLEAERIALPSRYAAFVSALGLSQEQAGKFEAEELAAAERTLDIKATAQAQGLLLTDPAIATLLSQSDQELNADLTNLLGADGYSQLQQYDRTLPTRAFVNTLAGELALTGSPLNAQQANVLVGQLSAANSSYQNGGPATSPSSVSYGELMATQSQAQEPIAWDSIKSQVQANLTDSQFALLNSMIQDSQTTVELYNMMQRASDAPMVGFMYTRKTP
jgi:hypothetical protein